MTDQYAVQRARPLTADVEPEAVGVQWQHSILRSPDYVSPWQAVEDAVDLAFELNPSCFIASASTVHYAACGPNLQPLVVDRSVLTIKLNSYVGMRDLNIGLVDCTE